MFLRKVLLISLTFCVFSSSITQDVRFPSAITNGFVPVASGGGGGNRGGIDLLFSRVMEESRDFVKRSYVPLNAVLFNDTVMGHGHGLGGHAYCRFTPTTEKIGKFSNINIKAFEILTQRFQIPKKQVIPYLRAKLPEWCMREEMPLKCDYEFKYRTIDGTCNNLVKPYWGSAFTEFDRLVPSEYADGWNAPRAGKLPNVRQISVTVHPDYVNPDNRMTNMVPQFGQFLDHDITLTPEADKKCCTKDQNYVDCYPIRIPHDDYFFSKLRSPQSCMDFTRSTPICFPSANGQREQMNIVTAFVDASHVYASEPNKTLLLRSFSGGRFLTNEYHQGFLPTVKQVQLRTREHIHFMGHFYGGEERVNEMPALTVMHTLLFREHNRIADLIAQKRPNWSDEQIFQETRRIVIAEWQNSVYGEYLPIILGEPTMRRYGLSIDDKRLFTTYNQALNPSVFHSFADAAYRFGHTLISGLIRMMKGFQELGKYRIRDNFFNHAQISLHGGQGYDAILGGLMAQNSQTYDPFITEDVTNFLLKEPEMDFGGDLIARNLHRAREHGLPGYHAYRQICELPAITDNWENRPANIPQNVWKVLGSMYQSPFDIDLFTGGLAEVPVTDGVTGHTFNCLKALQFRRAKYGDRFFFTHSHQAGSFTLEQLREIRKRNLGDIICDNSAVEMTTKNVFKMPSEDNQMRSCRDQARGKFNIDVFLS